MQNLEPNIIPCMTIMNAPSTERCRRVDILGSARFLSSVSRLVKWLRGF
jgi:hypothetical protein